MTVTIRNTNEKYGDSQTSTGETLAEAVATMQAIIRDCGPEFADVVVGPDDYEVVRRFEVRDEGASEIIEAESMEDACEQAEEWLRDGSWDRNQTLWLDARVYELDANGDDTGESRCVTVTLEPEVPTCTDGSEDHDWQAPYEIVGGIKENPGCWGHGGGVVCHEVCMRCGLTRTTDTWAQRPDTGEQGLTSVAYDPDKFRAEWADYMAERDA